MPDSPKKPEPKIELRPDGWDRFARAVESGAKSGPQHRSAEKKKAKPEKKG